MLKVFYSLAIALLMAFFVGFGIRAFYQAARRPPMASAKVDAAQKAEKTHPGTEAVAEQAKTKLESLSSAGIGL